jgi:hypothetical protein
MGLPVVHLLVNCQWAIIENGVAHDIAKEFFQMIFRLI